MHYRLYERNGVWRATWRWYFLWRPVGRPTWRPFGRFSVTRWTAKSKDGMLALCQEHARHRRELARLRAQHRWVRVEDVEL